MWLPQRRLPLTRAHERDRTARPPASPSSPSRQECSWRGAFASSACTNADANAVSLPGLRCRAYLGASTCARLSHFLTVLRDNLVAFAIALCDKPSRKLMRLSLILPITDGAEVRKILGHIGVESQAPSIGSSTRATAVGRVRCATTGGCWGTAGLGSGGTTGTRLSGRSARQLARGKTGA